MSLAGLIRRCVEQAVRGAGVRCDFFMAEDLYPLEQGTLEELRRVLAALVRNALQVMPAGETVFLSVENVTVEEGSNLPVSPGRYVKVSLSDPAAVIPIDNIECKWHMDVESEGGAGTRVAIYVPASTGGGPRQGPVAGRDRRACTARILVMDDEEMIRHLTRDFLEPYGHRVEFAGEGGEAVERFKRARDSGEPFDAVILDLNIQRGMDGKETIKKLLEIDPDVRAIASSGLPDDPVMLDYESHGFRGAIAKPFSMARLHSLLHRILGAGG